MRRFRVAKNASGVYLLQWRGVFGCWHTFVDLFDCPLSYKTEREAVSAFEQWRRRKNRLLTVVREWEWP